MSIEIALFSTSAPFLLLFVSVPSREVYALLIILLFDVVGVKGEGGCGGASALEN